MASKQWHLRASWSLDELTDAIVKHFGYADRTALLKSLVRGCALVGRGGNHAMLLRFSRETPAVQDKIDAEMLRMWNSNEAMPIGGSMRKMAERVAKDIGTTPDRVLERTAESIIEQCRNGDADEVLEAAEQH